MDKLSSRLTDNPVFVTKMRTMLWFAEARASVEETDFGRVLGSGRRSVAGGNSLAKWEKEKLVMSEEQFEKGLQVQKAVLGAEYVERSLSSANSFTQEMQRLTAEFCWGEIWTREGLDRKTGSVINLSMLTALNRPHELRIHVRGAINNGLSVDEIKELFLQIAIYCGVPAGMDSFRIAGEVIKEIGLI